MSYETKNITFHMVRVKLSSDFGCSKTLPMNVAIESQRSSCERNLCKEMTWDILWLNLNIVVDHPRKITSKGKMRKMLRKILSSQHLICSWIKEYLMG